MPRFNCEYVYTKRFGTGRHNWKLIGAKGGINLHIEGPHTYSSGEHYSAGLEFHWRSPPAHMKDDAPSHVECWLLKCPCWHDGTSLYAHETFLPRWLSAPHDHDRMFTWLEYEYNRRFNEDE